MKHVILLFATAIALAFFVGYAIGVLSARRYVERIIKSCASCQYLPYLDQFKKQMQEGTDQRVAALLREDLRRKQSLVDGLKELFPHFRRDPKK